MKNIEKHGIKGNSKTFFILAIMAGFGIGLLEVLIIVIEHIIWGVTILDNVSFFLVMRHWGITILVWDIFAVVLYRAAKANGFKFFSVIDKPTIQNLIIVAVLLGILIIVSYVDWDYQFKPYAEYLGKLNAFGGNGIYAFVMQYVYYIFEVILIFLCISFAQKSGEILFHSEMVPWGGIFLGFSWGLSHILSKGLDTGPLLLFYSVVYGYAYLLLRKNPRYAYWVIYLMFVL